MREICNEEIRALFPSVDRIEDDRVRDLVLEMWRYFYEKGNWDRIEEAYFLSLCPEYSLIEHTNYVTDLACAMAEVMRDKYAVKINWDVLLASCLLHDVSKLVETVKDEKGFHENETGARYQHAFLSASYAHEHGMPADVVSNLITHTGDSKRAPVGVEGIILYYVDMIDTDQRLLALGEMLDIERNK